MKQTNIKITERQLKMCYDETKLNPISMTEMTDVHKDRMLKMSLKKKFRMVINSQG